MVGVAAGLIDGLKLGENSKAAIIRLGLLEMRKFCHLFYEGVQDASFFESCGVAELEIRIYSLFIVSLQHVWAVEIVKLPKPMF